MVKKENKLVYLLNHLEEIIICALFAIMVIIIFVQVIMRFVFNNSLYWSEELGKFIFIWISWMGLSLAERKGEHIIITMLTDKLPPVPAKIFNIISKIIVIGICAITCYYGTSLVMSQAGTHYAGIKISVAWGYFAVVIGTGAMTVRSVVALIKAIAALVKGEELPDPKAEPEVVKEGDQA